MSTLFKVVTCDGIEKKLGKARQTNQTTALVFNGDVFPKNRSGKDVKDLECKHRTTSDAFRWCLKKAKSTMHSEFFDFNRDWLVTTVREWIIERGHAWFLDDDEIMAGVKYARLPRRNGIVVRPTLDDLEKMKKKKKRVASVNISSSESDRSEDFKQESDEQSSVNDTEEMDGKTDLQRNAKICVDEERKAEVDSIVTKIAKESKEEIYAAAKAAVYKKLGINPLQRHDKVSKNEVNGGKIKSQLKSHPVVAQVQSKVKQENGPVNQFGKHHKADEDEDDASVVRPPAAKKASTTPVVTSGGMAASPPFAKKMLLQDDDDTLQEAPRKKLVVVAPGSSAKTAQVAKAKKFVSDASPPFAKKMLCQDDNDTLQEAPRKKLVVVAPGSSAKTSQIDASPRQGKHMLRQEDNDSRQEAPRKNKQGVAAVPFGSSVATAKKADASDASTSPAKRPRLGDNGTPRPPKKNDVNVIDVNFFSKDDLEHIVNISQKARATNTEHLRNDVVIDRD